MLARLKRRQKAMEMASLLAALAMRQSALCTGRFTSGPVWLQHRQDARFAEAKSPYLLIMFPVICPLVSNEKNVLAKNKLAHIQFPKY
jgi:hypothetical protein